MHRLTCQQNNGAGGRTSIKNSQTLCEDGPKMATA